MKLLFDQNLSWRLPAKLSDLYPDSQHMREVGKKESEDVDVWNYAKANGISHRVKGLGLSAAQLVVWASAESCALARGQLHRSNNRRFVAAVFTGSSHIRA